MNTITLQIISLCISLIGTILIGCLSPNNRHVIDGGGASSSKNNSDVMKNRLVKLGVLLLCVSINIQLYILILCKA